MKLRAHLQQARTFRSRDVTGMDNQSNFILSTIKASAYCMPTLWTTRTLRPSCQLKHSSKCCTNYLLNSIKRLRWFFCCFVCVLCTCWAANAFIAIIASKSTCFQEYNVLRIKFLGDCYYCVSGVPEPNPQHARSCVDLGLRMIRDIREVRAQRNNLNIDMRIGVHSGSIMSGVIGACKW